MKTNHQIVVRAEQELPIHDRDQVLRDWSKYVRHDKALRSALEIRIGFFEYNFWLTMKDERWFMDGLDLLLESFHQAKNKNESDCLQACADREQAINIGLKNMHQLFHLEGKKSTGRLDLLAKICFREIGDIVEGGLKPFMLLMLSTSRIANSGSGKSGSTQEVSLGGATAELLLSGKSSELYQPPPWNVPIHQWRNIAQHYSFRLDSGGTSIQCTYGTKGDKTISLDRDGVLALLSRVHATFYVHKIAHLLFFVDNMQEIAARLTAIPELSEDSIKSHLITCVMANKFKVLSLKTKAQAWRMTLHDEVFRRPVDRRTALNEIAAAFRLVEKNKGLNLTVHYANENGEQTLRARVK